MICEDLSVLVAFPGQAKQQSHWVLGELLHSRESTFAGCVALDMDTIPTGQGCRVDSDVLRVSGDCGTKVGSCTAIGEESLVMEGWRR